MTNSTDFFPVGYIFGPYNLCLVPAGLPVPCSPVGGVLRQPPVGHAGAPRHAQVIAIII